MGVPGGWAFVEGTQTTVKVRDLGGQVVIEDGMILAVKGAIVNSQSFFGSSADKYAGAVAYVKDCLLWWASKGVRAVLGLDGRRVDAKAHAHSTRDTRRKKTEELLKDTTLSPDQRDRLIKQVLRVDTAYILAITNMARSEGIVVYRAPFEFDPQGALLNRLGANYAVVSRDNDLLWYGAGRVIREVNRKDCTVVMYTAERVWQAATTAGQARHAPFNKTARRPIIPAASPVEPLATKKRI